MSASPPIHDFLDDDSLAPLKRNHACLQCKKRKVKCDGTKPACAPCMRSHAHALRTAQRNKTSPPVLTCTWAENEGDSDDDSATAAQQGLPQAIARSQPPVSGAGEARKKTSDLKRAKGSLVGGKTLEREKEKRRDEEKDSLLARIAQLEARLEALSSSDRSGSQPASSQHANAGMQQSPSAWGDVSTNISPVINASKAYTPPLHATVEDISPLVEPTALNPVLPNTSEFDFGNLFMVPAHWPYGLPSPFLLEHLVEVFFSHAPQMPRMIHRASFLARLRLPPNNPNFPHASLLHAICAYASTFTAWVNNLPPEQLEAAVERHKAMYNSLDGIEDFGLAQAEAAQRAIRFSTQACQMGDGNQLIEIVQANIMLSDIYFTKGMPMQGWIIAGTPARILKSLEIMNRNKHERHKEPLAPEPKDAIQREERLATIWMAFIMDAGFTLNSYWNGSMELDEVYCNLPIAYDKFKETNEYQPVNPQTAHSPDLLASHPVADSFVLAAKASTLISRVSRWLRDWTQRDIVAGDELNGIRQPSFTALVNDIYVFQASVPAVMKNIFRIVDASPNRAFDANVLLVHILPHVALCLLHEPFVNWRSPINHTLAQMQQSYEAIVGLLHLIPSNLDISLITTSLLAFCMYTTGRIIANFVQKSLEAQQYGNAVKHRADLQTVQNILNRYGQKHQLGTMMSGFLDSYLAGIQSGKHDMSTTKCIGESLSETKMARNANNVVDEAATAAAAQMYYTTPQTFSHRMGSLERHRQMTADRAQRTASGSSVGYSASSTSGITPPMISSATPPSALASGSSHQGSATCASISSSSGAPTPDVLDWTNQMDYTATGSIDIAAQFGQSEPQQHQQQQQQQQHSHQYTAVNLLGSSNGQEACWSVELGAAPPGMNMPSYDGTQQAGLPGLGSHATKMGVAAMDMQEREMRNFAWTDDGSQIVWAAQ